MLDLEHYLVTNKVGVRLGTLLGLGTQFGGKVGVRLGTLLDDKVGVRLGTLLDDKV